MAKGFKHGAGGGGAGLNFKVVGNPKPGTAKENTIWIDTNVEITSWIFSATEPETPAEGMAWIYTGTSGPMKFNALKKNSIMVSPISAKQYVSGAWVNKVAETYQGGKWTSWITFLIQQGSDNTAITGGWKSQGKALSGHEAYAPTVANSGDHITLTLPIVSGKWRGGIYIANNKLNLTDIKTITVVGSGSTGNSSSGIVGFRIWSSIGSYLYDNSPAGVTISGSGEYSLDVSAFTGNYIVGFCLAASDTSTLQIYDVYYSL